MIEYTKERPLRCFYAFAGYNSQKMALQRLADVYPDFHHVCVGWSEIDENAIKANNAVFPEDIDKNFGDITKIDWDKVPDFDLFTYSFPCQDISSSGKQRGFEEGAGTRSSLLWECKKAIEAKKPRFLMMENVKALVSAKFLPFLRQWQTWLHQQGYENFTQVLNASSYNVPQNRERVFMISILRTDSEPNPSFYFPKKMKLERRIKDILEPNVDESFYLSDKALEYFCRVNNDKSHGHNFTPKDGEDVAFTVRCEAVREWMITSLNMKNNHTPPQWIVDDMQPMLQCADGSSPTITTRIGAAGITNMISLGHYPDQGVLVQGHYE